MLPAVLFRRDNQAILRSPANYAASSVLGHEGIGTIRGCAAMPDLMGIACRYVRDPNRPRMRLVRLKEVTRRRVARLGGPAHKSNTVSIHRPDRIAIGVDAGSYEIYGFGRRVKDTDEAMIAASGNEDQMRTIGGPLSDLILPTNDQLLGLFAAIQRSHPDLPIAHISDFTLRRNFWRVANVHLFWLAAAPADTPNGFFRSSRIDGGFRELPVSILAFAADIDDSVRVG